MANPSNTKTAQACPKRMPAGPHRRTATAVLLLAGLLFGAAGCGEDAPAPAPAQPVVAKAQPAKEQKKADTEGAAAQADATAVAAAAVAEEKPSGFNYQPQVLRDPFQPYVELVADEGTKGPLEFYDLEEIDIFGIISGISDARGKVKAGGQFYTVRKKTPIGKNHGQVWAIRSDHLIIRERYRDEVTRGYKYVFSKMSMANRGTIVERIEQ